MIAQHFSRSEIRLERCFDAEPKRKTKPWTIRRIDWKGWGEANLIHWQRLAEIDLDPFYGVGTVCGITPIAIAGAFFQFDINRDFHQLRSTGLQLAVQVL